MEKLTQVLAVIIDSVTLQKVTHINQKVVCW